MDLSSVLKLSSLASFGFGVVVLLVAALRRGHGYRLGVVGVGLALLGLAGIIASQVLSVGVPRGRTAEPDAVSPQVREEVGEEELEGEQAPELPEVVLPVREVAPASLLSGRAGSRPVPLRCVPSSEELAVGASVSFEVDWGALEGDEYRWDFDDGMVLSEREAEHRFRAAGEYLVVASLLHEAKVLAVAFCGVQVCRPERRVDLVEERLVRGSEAREWLGRGFKGYGCSTLKATLKQGVKVSGDGCVCRLGLSLRGDGLSCDEPVEVRTSGRKSARLELSCVGHGDFEWVVERGLEEEEAGSCRCKWSKGQVVISEE